MILCDYLSRIAVDEGDPSEIIPIFFNALAQYRLAIDYLAEAYMITHFNVATRSSTNAAGINLPPIYGAQKGIDPTLKPENQSSKSQQTLAQPNLRTPNQRPIKPVVRWTPSQTLTRIIVRNPKLSAKSSSENIQKTPVQVQTPVMNRDTMPKQNTPNSICKQTPVRNQQTVKTPISIAQQASRKLIQRSVKFLNTPMSASNTSLPSPVKLFPPTQHDHVNTRSSGNTESLIDKNLTVNRSLSTEKHVDEETTSVPNFRQPLAYIPKLPPQQILMPQENPFDIQSDLIPYQDKEMEPVFKPPDLDGFLLPPVLGDQITDATLMHRYLPRQSDINKIMEQIKWKYLTKLQLPCSLRDMQAAYLNSPHFRDIYLAVGVNKLPNTTRSAKKLENDLRNAVYMIHGGLLYKYIQTVTGDSEPVLCIPVSTIDIFLEPFHSSILSGHMGMSKCVLTLQQKFYCPNLAYHVRMYIISCHVCQTFKNHKRFDRPFNRRIIDINAPSLSHISMDIKHMPPSKDKFSYILVMLCEISNFIVAVPMRTATAPEICEAIMENFIGYFGTPTRIVCDQDPAFMSHLTQWFLKSYGIHVTTASPTNHQSLMAEHGIKSLANILMKHLTGLGDNWPIYCKPAMVAYNSYATHNLDNLSPFEVALGRKAVLAPRFECKPNIPITGTHAEAHRKLQEKPQYFKKRLEEFRSSRLALMNKDRQHYGFTVGQIVYMYNQSGSQLQTSNRKIHCKFVGPLAIYKCISPNQFLLMSLDGVLYPVIVEVARLKPGLIPTHKGPVRTLSELRDAAKIVF